MSDNQATYKRWIGIIITLIILLVGFYGVSQLLAFYKQGEIPIETWYDDSFTHHQPKFEWELSDIQGAQIDEFQIATIQQAYTKAWHAHNLFIRSGIREGLDHYFSDSIYNAIMNYNEGEMYNKDRVELNHFIKPTLFSLDYQLIAFEDRNVQVISNIYDPISNELLSSSISIQTFHVVMTLDDGNWRVRHLHSVDMKHDDKKDLQAINQHHNFSIENELQVNEEAVYMKGINYYPMNSPWLEFWDEFDADVIQQDIKLIRQMNFNTVRIFIPFEIFGGGQVDAAKLKSLGEFLDMAHENDLMVMPTLFDFPIGYQLEYYTSCVRYIETILQKYGEHPAIIAWDLKNEADRDFETYGKYVVLNWLKFMLNKARTIAPNQFYTVGWSTAEAATNLHADLDIISFHYYNKPSEFLATYNNVIAQVEDKVVVVQEFGQTSWNPKLLPIGGSKKKQVSYYDDMLSTLVKEEISFVSWTLYDFDVAPTKVFGWKPWVKLPQKKYGLFDLEGIAKPAANSFQKHLSE